jgi:hypothetical protein
MIQAVVTTCRGTDGSSLAATTFGGAALGTLAGENAS